MHHRFGREVARDQARVCAGGRLRWSSNEHPLRRHRQHRNQRSVEQFSDQDQCARLPNQRESQRYLSGQPHRTSEGLHVIRRPDQHTHNQVGPRQGQTIPLYHCGIDRRSQERVRCPRSWHLQRTVCFLCLSMEELLPASKPGCSIVSTLQDCCCCCCCCRRSISAHIKSPACRNMFITSSWAGALSSTALCTLLRCSTACPNACTGFCCDCCGLLPSAIRTSYPITRLLLGAGLGDALLERSEEHTSELQSRQYL